MSFLKRGETAKKYNISGTTLDNWLEKAIYKENDLQIQMVGKKVKLFDNSNNHYELQRLALEAKTFKNKIAKKKCFVANEFYKIFSADEVLDIYKGLELKKEVNLKYLYRDIGAECCDKFYQSNDNYIKGLVNNLVSNSLDDFQSYISESKKINIIDIGPGNGYPVKPLLKKFNDDRRLNKYVTIDISEEINQIAKENVNNWFKELDVRTYLRDFENTHFGQIFTHNKSINEKESNLVLFIGSTLNNCDDRITIFKNVASGMLREDLFIATITLDHPDNQIKKDYIKNDYLYRQAEWFYNLIGIDEECQNNVKVVYNHDYNRNEKFIQLTKDYEITFRIGNEDVKVNLYKDEKIMYWKHYLIETYNLIKELELSGLELITFKKDYSSKNGLFIARLLLDSKSII